MLRQKCKVCGKYLIALEGEKSPFFVHPDLPCSGITDAVMISVMIEDDALQEIWQQEYPAPDYSDHALLNKIWDNKILRFMINWLIKK